MTDEEREKLEAADELAKRTAQRLDRHIASSGEVHRDLRSRVKTLEKLMKDLLRHRP